MERKCIANCRPITSVYVISSQLVSAFAQHVRYVDEWLLCVNQCCSEDNADTGNAGTEHVEAAYAEHMLNDHIINDYT